MQISDASSHFGPYRLLAPIGEGGMGRVWKALDTRLERVVALKLLKGDTPENRALLIREARTACKLQHPHIAIVFEAGELEGQPFMAMEYVEGSSLDHFRGRPMELSGLMRLALQASSALYHAHQKGIIHRDIKPENLVLTKDGQLKILDFGVAKRIQDAEPTAQDPIQAQATRQSISVGTPSYMSPEQVYALNQCPASDQFSLAVVLYEMATGRHPFRKLSLLETLQSIAKDKHTDPGVFRKELPEIFIRCLDRMLSKDASGRFKDLQEPLPLFEDLKNQYLTGSTPALVSARKSRFPRSWKLGLGLCLATGASAIVWFHLKAFETPIKTSEKAERKVVAVLPLEMRGVPSELNWTALSFRECMNMGLTRRSDLMVLDRIRIAEATEADAHRTLGDIVQDLGADYLVLCTLQGLGKDLRLYVRLVKGRAGEVVQQFQIHGSCDRILDMEAELTDRLPESLGSLTLPDRPAPRARQVRTRERYAKGLELLYQGDPASYDQAAKLFEEGIQEEPDYAPLHTGLAAAWLYKSVSVSHMGSHEIKGLQERALERVSKAIALDDGTAFSYRILCEVLHRLGRFEEARKAGFRAVVLDPADFRCHANLGDTYAYESTPHSQEEAERFYKRAIELCPSDWFAHHRYGVSLQNRGALEEALASNEKARKLQPNAPFTHLTSALCHAWLGRVPEAQACIDEGLLHAPDMPLLRASQAVLAHRRKDFKTFNQAWSGLKTAWPENHSMAVLLKGLELHLTQGLDAAERFYLAHLKASRAQNWAQKTVLEHRTASVNLYHMAQAMAILGRKASAKALLDEAERLQVGKRAIAEKDPAFDGM